MTDLQAAASLITKHIETLNVQKTVCPCCGVTKYEDFTQFQMHKELTALLHKLRRWDHPARAQ